MGAVAGRGAGALAAAGSGDEAGDGPATAAGTAPATWDDGLIARRASDVGEQWGVAPRGTQAAPRPHGGGRPSEGGTTVPRPEQAARRTGAATSPQPTRPLGEARHEVQGGHQVHGGHEVHGGYEVRGTREVPDGYGARGMDAQQDGHEAHDGHGAGNRVLGAIPRAPERGALVREGAAGPVSGVGPPVGYGAVRAYHAIAAAEAPAPVTVPAPPAPRRTGGVGAPRTPVAPGGGATPWVFGAGDPRDRLAALERLVGMSRGQVEPELLADAARVLGSAGERFRLSAEHTVVALAGATGSGKSSLFNALAGAGRSRVGIRRPTTYEPVACVWSPDVQAPQGLLRRLRVPSRRQVAPATADPALTGLILLDLPDHDSATRGQREQLDRMLSVVDAVIWVVDPEKYADAALHERYLRPLAGYAEVTFVVLNQVDRLPGDAAEQVLDDLRRLLDEDGLALGEHGEPGAAVFGLSAATGEGVDELRAALAQFVSERGAAQRRVAADVDAVAARMRPAYLAEGQVAFTEESRSQFGDRLAEAVGAAAVGRAAESDWLRHAERAYCSPWSRLAGLRRATRAAGPVPVPSRGPERATSRPLVEQAVRGLADDATQGLPGPWAAAVREAAERGGRRLPEELDKVARRADRELAAGPSPAPRWWRLAFCLQAGLFVTQLAGLLWLLAGVTGPAGQAVWPAALLAVLAGLADPGLVALCRAAARGPARRYGLDAEQRLRVAVAAYGRVEVLEPTVAELGRYRQVRELYVRAAGG
ncbi:GTPase [Streptomyces sp. NPDC059740]|uniref:GTPase n=1 Tax=Streptomyces sp. NPDC059740 TaxID=3346926 RepID=UPI003649109A